jgi:hypothetical protein
MPVAYSFQSDLRFQDAIKVFDALENWVRKPNLDGRWLVRDNDRVGDYLSYYAYDEKDRGIVKKICIYFDTDPLHVTLGVSREAPARFFRKRNLQDVWREHELYVLNVLLPSIGARDVKASDFEK